MRLVRPAPAIEDDGEEDDEDIDETLAERLMGRSIFTTTKHYLYLTDRSMILSEMFNYFLTVFLKHGVGRYIIVFLFKIKIITLDPEYVLYNVVLLY